MQPWTHIEYGAANYGRSKNVLPYQFEVLKQTIAELVREKGAVGRMFINDKDSDAVDYTLEQMHAYLADQGLDQITLIPHPGKYQQIILPETDTAHLKHPDTHLFSEKNNPKAFLERMKANAREGLEITLWQPNWPVVDDRYKQGVHLQELGVGISYYSPKYREATVPSKRFLML